MSLSIGVADYASQRLAALLSQLTASQSASSAAATSTSTSSTSTTSSATVDPSTAADPCNNLTGSAKPSLSGEILMTLIQMQGATTSGATTASTAAASTAGSTDPVQGLFNAMDADGNGSVSQSEMESYLEANGGTQGEADALYSALTGGTSSTGTTGTASTGLSESQFASAVQQTQQQMQAGHHHHHHHHHGGMDGSANGSSPVDSLMSLLDSNGDGSVSQSEFTSFVTSNGGSATDAASDFTALDSDNSGTITSADLSKAWENIQNQQNAGPLAVSVLDAFAKANGAATAPTTSISA